MWTNPDQDPGNYFWYKPTFWVKSSIWLVRRLQIRAIERKKVSGIKTFTPRSLKSWTLLDRAETQVVTTFDPFKTWLCTFSREIKHKANSTIFSCVDENGFFFFLFNLWENLLENKMFSPKQRFVAWNLCHRLLMIMWSHHSLGFSVRMFFSINLSAYHHCALWKCKKEAPLFGR